MILGKSQFGSAILGSDTDEGGFRISAWISQVAVTVTGLPADISISSKNAPIMLFPGYSFDGTNLRIPVSDLSQLSEGLDDPVSGSWVDILQAWLLEVDRHIADSPITWYYRTVREFTLEDWNRRDARFGRHMKRSVSVQFITKNPIADIVEE